MNIDRELQLRLLNSLAEQYPAPVSAAALGFEQSDRAFVLNIAYLHEHELVRAVMTEYLDGAMLVIEASITAAGLDFLAQDGGLTAALGVLTVRLDAETLRELIGDKIDVTPMPPEEKARLKNWLSAAGSEAMKEATKRLVGAALDHAPDVLRLLQTLPG